ncbi:hypothetical protein HYY72_02960 [Candidatus Woesearchaeota archaeon]|nr:hypothetical protein [Candidatus Woesearchaeota archaeon]
MRILGINHSHDAGAAIIEDGRIVAAVNEERLNRVKLYWGFPFLSIKEVLRISGIEPGKIDYVAISNITPGSGIGREYHDYNFRRKMMGYLAYLPFIFGSNAFASFYRSFYRIFRSSGKLSSLLRKQGIDAPVEFIEHHEGHAASALYTSPFDDDTLVITTDGAGDGYCSTISTVNSSFEMNRVAKSTFFNSPASIYGYTTYNLGFTPNKDEGKLTGLAAHGKAERTYEIFKKIETVKGLHYKVNMYPPWGFHAVKKLHHLLWHKRREDVAAGLQKRSEEVAVALVTNALKKYPRGNIALAGGLFANVRINQEISRIPGVKKIYIHPHMGDGGQGVGAAQLLWADRLLDRGHKPKPVFHDNVYLGPGFSDDEIESALRKGNLKYSFVQDIEQEVAELVKNRKVVGRFNGRMEYGPRALGNRSIIASPTDKTINDWLNKKLKRTEWMPFAPSMMREHAEEYFNNFAVGEYAAKFMTITFDCTKTCAKNAPAITHIDNTARPQTVAKAQNPSYYKLLTIYKELSGLPIFVNTSFNEHEQPIVCSPKDAVDSFKQGNIDCLAIGNYLVE